MSETTGEGTYFSAAGGCHGGGRSRCQACGGTSYSMRADAPRCDGCHRIVLRDEGATPDGLNGGVAPTGWEAPAYSSSPGSGRPIADAFDRAFFEGDETASGDDMLRLKGRLTGANQGNGEPLTLKKLEEIMGELTPATPAPPAPDEMTHESVMDAVLAIVNEHREAKEE
jgi:hypothetical protein